MKGTKDKMEVDGTKLQLVAAVFPQENKRKRAEAQKKKKGDQSLIWPLPKGSEVWPHKAILC